MLEEVERTAVARLRGKASGSLRAALRLVRSVVTEFRPTSW